MNEHYFSSVSSFIHKIEVTFHYFDLQRCDERTFFITVILKYRAHQLLCDFIYILDHPEVYSAISINEHYANAKKFFEQHVHHTLLYSDELLLAQNFMDTSSFKKSIRQFAKKYPKYISEPY
ncbi:hypothetical protein ACMGD3_20440 [Lysinibacillus sphaericus]|uniref:hypothetical protein n=1 Tax=Lysinibacillus sphaericus TaxID=1421 RepID=UPI003F7B1D02